MSGHHDHHGQIKNKNILLTAFLLTIAFAVLEIVYGLLSQSLALLSEGIHMFSDGLNLFMSFVAITIGMRAVTKRHTFGFRRIETITAFLNGLALMVIPVVIFFEAIHRFRTPREVDGSDMLVVAFIGLLINVFVAFLLHRGDQSSLNVRAASLHVLSDLLSSVATIVAAIVIMSFGWTLIDPLLSIIVSISIFIGGVKITKEAFHCLMEGTPYGVDAEAIEQELAALHGVVSIDEVKLWAIASGINYLTVHATISSDALHDEVLRNMQTVSSKHHFQETIQLTKNE